jgi:hypothetical protein
VAAFRIRTLQPRFDADKLFFNKLWISKKVGEGCNDKNSESKKSL